MTALTVFLKELVDALRDRRTWIVVLVGSVIAGPAALLLVSNFVSGVEERAARREIVIDGIEHAPTLVNFLQRAGATVVAAPADYADQLRSGRLQNAVIRPPADFERQLASGATVRVDVLFDDSHDKAQPVVRASLRLLAAFNRELGMQRLVARGVSPQLLEAIEAEEQSLSPAGARGAQLLFIVPWVALLVAVAGSMSVAIDVTAGERDSLEPLLGNPVDVRALVLGKWAAVTVCSAAIVVLTIAGFIAAMQFIRNETLSALMQFGAREVGLFAVMLLPFSALMAAVNMLAATYGRSFKEAQTYVSYITMLVNVAPIVPLFLSVRDAAWQLAVPALGQLAVLMRG
ncbi:MAG: ABC transporter permease subunit, partial [Burkholderiaceae bacterium]|nr:ABC transporter permease subunit [Burkholderiaceae bacterium]